MKKILLLSIFMGILTGCQESLEDKAAREASEYTEKNCPIAIQKSVVLDSITFERATHTYGYHYRLLPPMDTTATIDPSFQQKDLVSRVKNTTTLQEYKEAGYNFRYTYRSEKDHSVIYFDTTITPEDYK
jgi:hypothetical protein